MTQIIEILKFWNLVILEYSIRALPNNIKKCLIRFCAVLLNFTPEVTEILVWEKGSMKILMSYKFNT